MFVSLPDYWGMQAGDLTDYPAIETLKEWKPQP